ncbi:mechanosensitive ion channel protein 6-like [Rhododendron vialii]|uniref:mechanosensitive ion channel protein 6-like n=1 Tax=Rhododendron vialii TaxID=182163 RepID=UPI00265F6BFA|nr:mechanosensitive ion channel protein 6-like [Rhododendron vialii]
MKCGINEDDPFLEGDLPEEYQKMKFTPSSAVQFVSLVFGLAALACNLGFPKFMKNKLFELEMWKWESLVLVLISGHLVSGWAIRVVLFFIERNFLLRKRVLYFVYGVRNAVQNCIWMGLVMISWHFMFGKTAERMNDGDQVVFPFLARLWICLLLGTFIWLMKKLVVKALASSFHVSKFFDRIQESLFNQYVIETLSGPPLFRIQHGQEEANAFPINGKARRGSPKFPGGMSHREGEGISIDHLQRMSQKNVSAWNMKRLVKIVRKGLLSTLKAKINVSPQITSEAQARAAAKKIFFNVAKPGSKCIYMEDLLHFLREDVASKTMTLLQGASECKEISKQTLKNWVVYAFKEQRALSLSLDDTKSAVNKLHQLLNIAVAILVFVISLLILRITSTPLLVFLGSQLLAGYLFGNSWKTAFEAIIFVFVTHPFDVGDRCEVDGVQMVVEEMTILTTVFLRYDNQKVVYPNCLLATKPISNYYRSPDMRDAVDFCIHIATAMEKIAMMKDRITRYVETNSNHWHPAPVIVLRGMEDMNRLKYSVWLSHQMNHQDMDKRWMRRTLLVEEMIKIFRELDIEYQMLPAVTSISNWYSNWNTTFAMSEVHV